MKQSLQQCGVPAHFGLVNGMKMCR